MVAKLIDESQVLVHNTDTAPATPSPEPLVRTTIERPTGLVRKRMTFNSSKLGVDVSRLQEAGWHCHWANDDKNRISDMLDIGYLFVELHEVGPGGVSMGSPSADSSNRVSRRVGTNEDGSAMLAYLMKTSNEYHAENNAFNQLPCDRIDAQIKSGAVRQADGSGEASATAGVDPESQSHFYRHVNLTRSR